MNATDPSSTQALQSRSPLSPAAAAPRHAVFAWIVTLLAMAQIWLSAGNHPLYPPDEGRYATASLHMAEGSDWLMPTLYGEPHLTKPPLTYWAQALSMKLLGKSEFAARAPSLLAGALTILTIFCFGRCIGGARLGAIAAGLHAIMPLSAVVTRLAVTDPILNLFWLLALIGGWQTVRTARARWAILMWTAIALGLLTKGPLALSPLGLIVLWLALARRWSDLRKLKIAFGLPAACVPILLWAGAVAVTNPNALDLWWRETIKRAAGSGAHSEPPWYYVPIAIAGLIPANVMLPLPGISARWSAVRAHFKRASTVSLLMLSLIVPFICFSLMSGKLPTYLLPMCAPCALLAAIGVEQWLQGVAEERNRPIQAPAVGGGFTIAMSLFALAPLGAAIWLAPSLMWITLPMTLVVPIAVWMWIGWKRTPRWRTVMITAAWFVVVVGWQSYFIGEEALWRRFNARELINTVQDWRAHLPSGDPFMIAQYGMRDATVDFYVGQDSDLMDSAREMVDLARHAPGHLLVIADVNGWKDFAQSHPRLSERFRTICTCTRWLRRQSLVLERIGPAEISPIEGDPND